MDRDLEHARPGDRADVEDGSRPPDDHAAHDLLGDDERAFDVDVHQVIPVGLLDQGEGQDLGRPGVVDQDVDPSEGVRDAPGHGRHAPGVEDRDPEGQGGAAVRLDRLDDLRGPGFLLQVVEGDVRALPGEDLAQLLPQGARPARDQSLFSFKQHRPPPFVL
jgi:hypothetical protein